MGGFCWLISSLFGTQTAPALLNALAILTCGVYVVLMDLPGIGGTLGKRLTRLRVVGNDGVPTLECTCNPTGCREGAADGPISPYPPLWHGHVGLLREAPVATRSSHANFRHCRRLDRPASS